MEESVLKFIKEFYRIAYSKNGDIFIMDVFESQKVKGTILDITPKVKFVWGQAFNITQINLYRKDNNNLPNIIREVFRDKRSMDFYKFLTDNKEVLKIPLREVKEEFPSLYGQRLQEIISKNTTKDNL